MCAKTLFSILLSVYRLILTPWHWLIHNCTFYVSNSHSRLTYFLFCTLYYYTIHHRFGNSKKEGNNSEILV